MRVDGDVAVVGISRLRPGPARRGRLRRPARRRATRSTAGETFGEIESVKSVSELFAPVSGEVVEVNEALADSPETVNEDPYGEGWMIKVKVADAVRGRRPAVRRGVRGVHRRGGVSAPCASSPSPCEQRDADASRVGVAVGRRRCSTDIPEASRLGRPLDLPDGHVASSSSQRHLDELAARDLDAVARRELPRRRLLRPLRARRSSTRVVSQAGVLHRVHALPARGQPGHAAGDLRVPVDDLRADRAWTSRNASHVRRRDRDGRGGAAWPRTPRGRRTRRRRRRPCTPSGCEVLRTYAAGGHARRRRRPPRATASLDVEALARRSSSDAAARARRRPELLRQPRGPARRSARVAHDAGALFVVASNPLAARRARAAVRVRRRHRRGRGAAARQRR